VKTRSLLWWTCSALLLLTLAASAAPVEIAPGVHLLRGEFVPGRQPDGNSILLEGRGGWIVVDTGRHREHTQAILDVAKPLVAVFNTHWHLDHTGGNLLVRQFAPGPRIYATGAMSAALEGFLANYATQLHQAIDASKDAAEQERYRTELGLIEQGEKLAPDEVIAESGPRTIAGRKLEIHVERNAATAADLWILDRKTKTLIAGDLVTLPFPFLDTACPAGWKEALDHLSAAKFDLLVPGHGAPMQRAQFEQYRRAFANLISCGASSRTNDECASGWLADAAGLIKDEDEFVRQGVAYYLDTALRPGKAAERCPRK
jgi:glyoxylase-like metal-dependent hydrolase (beta-lactamase superfamily II)